LPDPAAKIKKEIIKNGEKKRGTNNTSGGSQQNGSLKEFAFRDGKGGTGPSVKKKKEDRYG